LVIDPPKTSGHTCQALTGTAALSLAFDLRLRLDGRMPYTPEAQAKIAVIYDWLRQRLVLLIVVAMLILQFMTWHSIEAMRQDLPRSPPRCSTYDPCVVSLDEYTIGKIRPK
jgi:hypothetical protein